VKAAGTRSILATCLPAAAAILVFGTLYGAAARAILGVPLALASSLFVYSGALQFALLALLSAGATTLPLVLIAAALNLRHLVLGAVLRPRMEDPGCAGRRWPSFSSTRPLDSPSPRDTPRSPWGRPPSARSWSRASPATSPGRWAP
jgi:predicted branched-subunit amino acid permease